MIPIKAPKSLNYDYLDPLGFKVTAAGSKLSVVGFLRAFTVYDSLRFRSLGLKG